MTTTKDSGIEWIGAIPRSWEVKPLFAVGEPVKRKNSQGQNANLLSLSYGEIKEKDIDSTDGLLPESFDTYQEIKPGDLVFRFTDLQNDKRSLRSAVTGFSGIITSAYLAFRPKVMHPKYLGYLMRSYDTTKVFYAMGSGLRQSLKYSDVRRMPVLVPPLEEQEAIADFLNRELAHIDRLIQAQQSLPILLNARYNAQLISATTRGLNPDEELVNSGLEWAPRKPQSWTIKPFFTVGRETSQKNKDSQESNLLSLSYGEIIEKDIDTNEGLLPASFDTYQIINPGNLVFRLTDLQNDKRSLRSALSSHKGIITSAYVAVQVSGVEPEFLAFQMRAWDLLKVFYSMGSGLRQSMKYEDLRRMPVVLPSLPEQQAIVRYLTQLKKSKNEVISETAKAVSLLKERRAALVNAAVTGKINLRGKN